MNRVALVTGSVKRLGKDIALRLAELKFDVVLNYFNSGSEDSARVTEEVRAMGVDVLCVKADLRKVSEIKKMFAEADKKFGRLDVLVNNAAIFERADFFDVTEGMFDEFISMNLKNAFFCSQESAKMMLKNGDKPCSIINIASLGAIENWQTVMPYSLAKTGIVKFTKLLAKRLAPDILVNAIAPGTIWIEGDENRTAANEDAGKYPMKRFGKSDDINSMIEYLAIKNKWTTGNVFVVDGGISL
ncbi:MAG: SDR family oxidoreductase [Ignavibacteriae bacterium]|nr:SDR family oxidoreductase [Ignavibacteriota bacterium]